MGQLPGPAPDYAGLFAEPSLDRMLKDLTSHEFEHFVGYVFEQAGYSVEDVAGQRGPGLDLKLYAESIALDKLRAGVQVKQYRPEHQVTAPEVGGLRNGIAQNGGVPGYFVTTSTFLGPALTQANESPRIWPIDGSHWLRYMAYLRGSRALRDASASPTTTASSFAPISPASLFAADHIVHRPTTTTKVLALANHKGGAGKTTTALNLAFGLGGKDYDQQVLLIDMDPQANLTRALASPHAATATPMHIGEYFTGKRSLAELVRPTQFSTVWLIPSHRDLTLSDVGLAGGPDLELRFVRDVHAMDLTPPPVLSSRPFDWIIIDTGPSMGFFTRSALAASHYVVMPLCPSLFANLGVDFLRNTIDTMSALTGVPITLLGGVVTQWQENQFNRDLLAPVAQSLPILGDKVPLDRPNIEKAHQETAGGKKRSLLDRRCQAARAYATVVEAIAK